VGELSEDRHDLERFKEYLDKYEAAIDVQNTNEYKLLNSVEEPSKPSEQCHTVIYVKARKGFTNKSSFW